ncbi:MAG: V-type ATP synthase subunit I [Sedimentisphaerales bacterium]|nr:V-type ATP synthase subunit I [Sedimentisphaerales bacterium]
MAVVPMVKFVIASYRREADELLDALQREGICQILNAEAATAGKEAGSTGRSEKTPKEIEELLNKLTRAIGFLKPFSKKAGGIVAILAPRIVVDKTKYEKVIADESLLEVIEQCVEADSQIQKLKTEIENYNARLEELKPWEGLEAAIEEFGRLKQVKCWVGFVPNRRFGQLQEAIAEAGAILDKVAQTANKSACVIIGLNENAEAIQKLLHGAEFEQANFAGVTGTVAQAIVEITEKVEAAKQEIGQQAEKAKSSAGHILEFKILHDYYSNLLNREKTKESAPATEQTVIYEGWVRKKDFSRLQKLVSRFSASSVQKIEPAEGEEIPVDIENKSVIRPFEVITRLYGMPDRTSVDPTVFLTPFFTVFFALCLADAGYGILMVLIAGWMIKKMQGDKKLLWMLAICGVSTAVFGAMTGGWFGDVVQQFVPALKIFREKLMIFDPLENPIPFLLLSIGLGYFQINFGLTIALVHNLRRKEYIAAVCDQLTWLVMLNSLVLFGCGKFGLIDSRIGGLFGKIAILPAVAILLFSQREGSIGARLGMGFYNVFSTIFYLGDVLSYLRLMALGMVGAGLAMAVNVIAKLAMKLPYGIGIVLMILILVVGHLFNLGMSALGAFVHTLRLQFVEFFPKFLVGGGKAFEPLTKQYKHIYITGGEKTLLKD